MPWPGDTRKDDPEKLCSDCIQEELREISKTIEQEKQREKDAPDGGAVHP